MMNTAFDREKLLAWLDEQRGRGNMPTEWSRALLMVIHQIQSGAFDIKPPASPVFSPGDKVRHRNDKRFVLGRILEVSKSGKSAYVEWIEYDRQAFCYFRPYPAYYKVENLEKVEDAEEGQA